MLRALSNSCERTVGGDLDACVVGRCGDDDVTSMYPCELPPCVTNFHIPDDAFH